MCKVWDLQQGKGSLKELCTLRGHTERVSGIAWMPRPSQVREVVEEEEGGRDDAAWRLHPSIDRPTERTHVLACLACLACSVGGWVEGRCVKSVDTPLLPVLITSHHITSLPQGDAGDDAMEQDPPAGPGGGVYTLASCSVDGTAR